MAKDSLAKASTPEPFSTSKTSNWVARGGGLPPYIQHVAHDLMEKRGMSESRAIAMAIGIIKNWAHGHASGGEHHVKPQTVAAARKALAEWQALKAKAHSHADTTRAVELVAKNSSMPDGPNPTAKKSSPKKPSPGDAQKKPSPGGSSGWDPAKHPRAKAGQPNGGQFVPLGKAHSKDAAAAQKDKGAQANYKAILTGKLNPNSLNDQDLAALSKILYSYDTSNPEVVKARIRVANALAKRGYDVKDFGAYGGGINSNKKLPSGKPSPGSKSKGTLAPAHHGTAKRTKLFEDGSAKYADGTVWNPGEGFGKPKKVTTHASLARALELAHMRSAGDANPKAGL